MLEKFEVGNTQADAMVRRCYLRGVYRYILVRSGYLSGAYRIT